MTSTFLTLAVCGSPGNWFAVRFLGNSVAEGVGEVPRTIVTLRVVSYGHLRTSNQHPHLGGQLAVEWMLRIPRIKTW